MLNDLEARGILISADIMMLSEIWLILQCIFSPVESSRFMHVDHEGQWLRCGFSLRAVFIRVDTSQHRLCRDLSGPSLVGKNVDCTGRSYYLLSISAFWRDQLQGHQLQGPPLFDVSLL